MINIFSSKIKWFACFVFLIIGLFSILKETEASTIFLKNTVALVQRGKTFSLPVTINPEGKKGYTVRLEILFPSDLLEVTSFSFEPLWLQVSQPKYDLIDNKIGRIIKTAGLPGGFSESTLFGNIVFRAKKSGRAVIVVGEQTFILDTDSKSTLTSRTQIPVIISEPELITDLKIKEPEILPDLPVGRENLFDVNVSPSTKEISDHKIMLFVFAVLGLGFGIFLYFMSKAWKKWRVNRKL